MSIIIFKILLVLQLLIIGVMFTFYEGIVVLNLFYKWGEWWSKKLFEKNKDRNNDGVVSYWERTFPKDGGHCFKRLLIVAISSTISFLISSNILVYIVLTFSIWLVISGAFEISLDIFRKLLASLIIMSLFAFCSPKITTNNKIAVKVKDTVTTIVRQSDKDKEVTNISPAVTNQILFTPQVDSNGNLHPVTIKVNSGDDTLSLIVTRKGIMARSNCTAQVNYWKYEAHKMDSIVRSKHDSVYVDVQYKEVEKIVSKLPWYTKIIYGVLIAIIIILIAFIVYLILTHR